MGLPRTQHMPLMEEDPPSPLPRGRLTSRPPRPGSGSVFIPQLKRFVFMGIDKAAGMSTMTAFSEPPASSTRMRRLVSSPRRLASTQPAEPAPAMM